MAFQTASKTVSAKPSGFGATGVFGSLELKTNKVTGAGQWRRVLRRIDEESGLYDACDNDKSPCPVKIRAWRRSMRLMHQFKGWDLLAAVNSKVNKLIDFRDDIDTYGQKDHWASPGEALTRKGDCEDYAILKYTSLLELGVDDEQMRIVVVMDTKRRIGHAILSVNLNGKTYILDSLRRRPVLHTKLSRYVPYYSINRHGQWLNLATRKRTPKIAGDKTIKIGTTAKIVIAKPKPTRLARTENQVLRGSAINPGMPVTEVQ